MSLHIRPGDLLCFQQAARPAVNLTARPGNVILAGAATSHAHHLTAGTIQAAPDGTLSLARPYAARVYHEEHHALPLESGSWLLVRKPEYSPEAVRTDLD